MRPQMNCQRKELRSSTNQNNSVTPNKNKKLEYIHRCNRRPILKYIAFELLRLNETLLRKILVANFWLAIGYMIVSTDISIK